MSSAVDFLDEKSVFSPFYELVAYEYLWSQDGSTLKKIAEKLSLQDRLPSEILEEETDLFGPPDTEEIRALLKAKLGTFSVMLKENAQYPPRLLDAKYPIDLFYYRGELDLLDFPSVSVVGTRRLSEDGRRRTTKLVKLLCDNGYTIVSGLAKGVDTVALETAIECDTKVIGVIGTPIDQYYPKENASLQEKIAQEHLLISQVPFYKYSKQSFHSKRVYFPERNATMSAISKATIIVEASDTSGTLSQARACIQQGRKLFILSSCFENPDITWPKYYRKLGAIRVTNIDDILVELAKD